MQDANALGGAAGGANGFGIATDDLAELADDHQLRVLVYAQYCRGLADLCGRLQVVDALRTTRGQTIFVDVGSLAVAVFGDGQNEVFASTELFVEFLERSPGILDGLFRVLLGSLEFLAVRIGALIFAHLLQSFSLFGVFGAQGFQFRSQSQLGGLSVPLLIARSVRGRDGDADDLIVLLKRNTPVAGGVAAHGAQDNDIALGIVFFFKANRHAIARAQEDGLLAIGDACGDQIIFTVNGYGDDAAGHDIGEVLERSLLHGAVARGEEDVLALFFQIADGQDGDDFFAGLEIEQALHRLTLAGCADVGNLVDLEPVDAAGVGEAEQEGVRGVDDELRDEIFFASLHAHAAGAAAALLAVDGDGRALEIALMADGHGDLF